MWKTLCESAIGTAHCDLGIPCQDYGLVCDHAGPAGHAVIAVCADGAGSASHADVGARVTCESVAEQARLWLDATNHEQQLSRDVVLAWVNDVRQHIVDVATSLDVSSRELACTLLGAVVNDCTATFFQVGDGAIVAATNGEFEIVFWPQSGEYANVTNFLTNDDVEQQLVFEQRSIAVDEFALLTDGLQMLALDFTHRQAHAPFFEPLFARLRSEVDAASLSGPLRHFLQSTPVNERTDDDKTLILASRSHGKG